MLFRSLEASADLTSLLSNLKSPISDFLSSLSLLPSFFSLTLTGDGSNVLTRAQLDFPKPLPFELEPWNMPTNLIHGPLHSFSAIQGLRPWLSVLKFWKDLGAKSPPNQVFFWAQEPSPFLTFAASPMPGASKFLSNLNEGPVKKWNPWLGPHYMGQIELDAGTLKWTHLPLAAPFMTVADDHGQDFLLAGFGEGNVTNMPTPGSVIRELFSKTNAVYYGRELTGARTWAWLLVGQGARLVGFRAQLPDDSKGNAWIRAIWQRLGNSTTFITEPASSEISLSGESTIGLNSLEIHLVADWLESPGFPLGLHTFKAPGVIFPSSRKSPPK